MGLRLRHVPGGRCRGVSGHRGRKYGRTLISFFHFFLKITKTIVNSSAAAAKTVDPLGMPRLICDVRKTPWLGCCCKDGASSARIRSRRPPDWVIYFFIFSESFFSMETQYKVRFFLNVSFTVDYYLKGIVSSAKGQQEPPETRPKSKAKARQA